MPRAGLSREAVVGLALGVVDDGGTGGFADLTLARVAAQAGVATPSLYKHVGSLAELRREVSVRAVGELAGATSRATVGLSGPDAVRAMAHAWRGYARVHPGRYAAAQTGPDPDDPAHAAHRDAAAESVAVAVATLRGFDLPEECVVDAVRAVRSAVHGFVTLELGGGFRAPQDVDRSFDALVDMLVAGIAALARREPG
ncbi:WHG domain-containing protein [Isoptericola sp. S6320L]|uniref:WHG domain-containing protein n=1 Tax=Isoptericola sp. S6320L TaxID=2926411 RepID=UPI001FF2C65C|nr:WHG domain-containing protein [Isoptericola sp. S6320L]MCK0117869.1 WHG domain-containing protein [Isoptericola sp. S6320L]